MEQIQNPAPLRSQPESDLETSYSTKKQLKIIAAAVAVTIIFMGIAFIIFNSLKETENKSSTNSGVTSTTNGRDSTEPTYKINQDSSTTTTTLKTETSSSETWQTYNYIASSLVMSFDYPSFITVTKNNGTVTLTGDDYGINLKITGTCDGCTVYPVGPDSETFDQTHTIEESTISTNNSTSCSKATITSNDSSFIDYEVRCLTDPINETHIWGQCGTSPQTLEVCDKISQSINLTN